MKNKNVFTSLVLLCLIISSAFSQQEMFYGTIETKDALELKKLNPEDIVIISSKNGFSAVKLSDNAAEELHHMILSHGPGFIYEESEEDALKTIEIIKSNRLLQKAASFTISESALVNQSLGLVNAMNVENHIKELVSYGTRYHTTQKAKDAVNDLKVKWENMASARTDVSVRIVNHTSTTMPSVIMTIQGSETANEHVIIGGHIDSVSNQSQTNAPGADDNASGIATITEIARVLFEMNFKPKRTIEIMAYAAEEVGLRGSKEIAEDYKARNVDVVAYVQFDMTNYKGSSKDVYISDDSYNSTPLNAFLVSLMDTYNTSGNHNFTYDYTTCNYGCSDHYSWAQQGYKAAFPFEASFNDSNPYIHTTNDTFNRSNNANHAAKFVKLGLEFLIEMAKSSGSVVVVPYCNSKGNSVADEYIQNVKLGAINKTSTGGNGYSDHTALSTDLSKGGSNTITITPKWTGTVYDEGYGVWIDYNKDGDFSDAGETVWTKAKSKTTPVSGSFTVPASALEGTTRMRVSMKYNATPTACDASLSYGEVEDYTVNIVSSAPDTQAPTGPSSLASSNVGQTTLTLTWSAATDNVAVTSYDVYKGSVKVGSTTSATTYNVTGLTAATAYVFSVKAKDASGNTSIASNVLNVTTLGTVLNYCASKGNSVADEYIQKVKLGSIDNTSGGGNGYSDYTSQSTNLTKGASNSITITPKWTGTVYNEGYGVWIDYNKDGDFSDAGETVWTKAKSKTTPVSGSFTVPASASLGATRMRISMKYDAIPTACEASLSYGEVEDYSVVIVDNSINRIAAIYSPLKEYKVGDNVLYGNTLYERVNKGWNQIDSNKKGKRKGFAKKEILLNDDKVIQFAPNSVKGSVVTIFVNNELWKSRDVVIFDYKGASVRKITLSSSKKTIDVSSLNTGIYFVTLENSGKKYTQRLIKE